jgi:hypothetical protein
MKLPLAFLICCYFDLCRPPPDRCFVGVPNGAEIPASSDEAKTEQQENLFLKSCLVIYKGVCNTQVCEKTVEINR